MVYFNIILPSTPGLPSGLFPSGLTTKSIHTKLKEDFCAIKYQCNAELTYYGQTYKLTSNINPLNAELNPICHFLALLGAHHIFHVSGLRVKHMYPYPSLLPDPITNHFALQPISL